MPLFQIKKFIYGRRLNSALEKKEGWVNDAEFRNLLKKERHRSDRSGLPISYIVIDLTNFESMHGRNSQADADYFSFLNQLINLVSDNSREYDIKHLFNPFKIGVILIDTNLQGAKKFIEKNMKAFSDHFQSLGKTAYLNIVKSIKISTYPLKEIPKHVSVEARPVIVSPANSESGEIKKRLTANYREKIAVDLQWNILPSPGGAVALQFPFTLDIQYDYHRDLFFRGMKKFFDILGSLVAIIVFTPLMLVVGLVVKMTSKGNILFKQKRIGYMGKPFTFLKFRTMTEGCDDNIHREYVTKLIQGREESTNLGSDEDPVYKLNSDPRITPIGRFLRRTSLDELPQFFNVLKGEMSLVGPRPPIGYEVETYKGWHLRRVLESKPGITGLWQVYGRSKTTFDEMVRLDLQYVNNRSAWLDIKIMFKTLSAVYVDRGAM